MVHAFRRDRADAAQQQSEALLTAHRDQATALAEAQRRNEQLQQELKQLKARVRHGLGSGRGRYLCRGRRERHLMRYTTRDQQDPSADPLYAPALD